MMLAHELEDDRVSRRNLTGLATGGLTGATLGLLLAAIFGAYPPVPALMAAALGALGALAGRQVAVQISPDEWDPTPNHRPYVGTNSPDDDIT
jgi:hypothetical protein